MNNHRKTAIPSAYVLVAMSLLAAFSTFLPQARVATARTARVAVGAQYDTTHVYLATGDRASPRSGSDPASDRRRQRAQTSDRSESQSPAAPLASEARAPW